jgi:hypothetical protein
MNDGGQRKEQKKEAEACQSNKEYLIIFICHLYHIPLYNTIRRGKIPQKIYNII